MSDYNDTCSLPLTNVLIVEDSKTFAGLLQRNVDTELEINATVFGNYADAKKHLANCDEEYFAALLDLNLPDAPNGEIVDLVVGHGIPSVVFTGQMNDELREEMWSKQIVDYVSKDNAANVEYVVSLMARLRKNLESKVLVVDDTKTSRFLYRSLLERWNFQVFEAGSAEEALEVLKENPDICLCIADYYMPGMDGPEMVREMRRTHSKSRLPIIGLSGSGGATTSAYFIKAGVNDYMHKPFLVEEFYCRVLHNLENSDYIAQIRELSEKDFMTGIYNRRSFFNYGRKLFASQSRGGANVVVAMADIDHFKKVNDTYGHDAGDEVIKYVARTFAERFRDTDLVSRFGGEEFCIMAVGMDPAEAHDIFDDVRKDIEATVINFQGTEIRITISTGVCVAYKETLEDMITEADQMLYEAKNTGRNQVVVAAE